MVSKRNFEAHTLAVNGFVEMGPEGGQAVQMAVTSTSTRRPRHVHVPRSTILPIREPDHRALRPRQVHPHSLGEYFQIQDDFLDFSEQTGKIGTDILDNKCSWCVNTALAVCTPEQRRVYDRTMGGRIRSARGGSRWCLRAPR